jgi:ribonucleoside-diphosphate reductase alpha chain
MDLMIVKRRGDVVDFDKERINGAINKAIRAINQNVDKQTVELVVEDIVEEVNERFIDFYPNVENIQDIVEKHLANHGLYDIAKAYILYRAKRASKRAEEKEDILKKTLAGRLTIIKKDGKRVMFDIKKLKGTLLRARVGFENKISEHDIDIILKETVKNLFDGIKSNKIEEAIVLAITSKIEIDPIYSNLAARIFLQKLYKECMEKSVNDQNFQESYKKTFVNNIRLGVGEGILSEKLLSYDLEKMAANLNISKDLKFQYLGLRVQYDRYYFHIKNRRMELPQAFWMRVAMGLALNEKNKEEKAIEFYKMYSDFRFISSTPTLFNSGTKTSQLSSCFLLTVQDDLNDIFKIIGDNAKLSKWAGGLGDDWTNIRGTNSYIKGTNGKSQGVIPFLKIANDTSVAVNQGGKRKGSMCSYLETWHLDIEDFLLLRRNTGDDRRRTHDMNTANWIPDLFMKRVIREEDWTLFSPAEVPDLHDLYGKKFEKRYEEYEQRAKRGELNQFKIVKAKDLWRKMITLLFETGHPWMTFKDPCNIRSPQDHVGVIHSSNLCTEITLNTSKEETAVCNLGSINLAEHIVNGDLDEKKLFETIKIAVRMLDNVIDLNYYPIPETKRSNFKHRPVGLGVMGFQDSLFKLDLPFESIEALDFADRSMELISFNAILASSKLAEERGTYESYKGSKWERGIFPQDTIELLEEERGMHMAIKPVERLDWSLVRNHVQKYGMRNSNVLAIAPTATISLMAGVYPCIEPTYKNIYVKANLSGEFTVVNSYMIEDLRRENLWNEEMLEQIKYHDGKLDLIPEIPERIKEKFKEAFDLDPITSLKMTAVRGFWIDQSQSHNVFVRTSSGNLLSDIYIAAWKLGLKTTYYLRSLGKTQLEKTTLDLKKYGYTQKREYSQINKIKNQEDQIDEIKPATQIKNVCSLMDPDCEACQ